MTRIHVTSYIHVACFCQPSACLLYRCTLILGMKYRNTFYNFGHRKASKKLHEENTREIRNYSTTLQRKNGCHKTELDIYRVNYIVLNANNKVYYKPLLSQLHDVQCIHLVQGCRCQHRGRWWKGWQQGQTQAVYTCGFPA